MKTNQKHHIESSLTRLHGDEYLKNSKDKRFGEFQEPTNNLILPQDNPKKRKREIINPYLSIKKTNVIQIIIF